MVLSCHIVQLHCPFYSIKGKKSQIIITVMIIVKTLLTEKNNNKKTTCDKNIP